MFIILFFIAQIFSISAQETKTKFAGFDGTIIAGYVDRGAFLNFTGPNVNVSFKKDHKIILGMLPSLRFKADKSTVKNAFITPSLGIGLTYCYKKFAVQIPLYYNIKTAVSNGRWQIGAGIGMRLK